MADLNLVVISNDRFDFAMWFNATLIPGDIGVLNVRSMVEAIKRACGTSNRIGHLTIVGHGNEDGQLIGKDWIDDRTVHTFAQDLMSLQPLFTSNAMVTMAGCHVGRAKPLLIALAHLFGVRVEAYSRLQFTPPPFYQGLKTTCFITCTSEQKTTISRAFDLLDDQIVALSEHLDQWKDELSKCMHSPSH